MMILVNAQEIIVILKFSEKNAGKLEKNSLREKVHQVM